MKYVLFDLWRLKSPSNKGTVVVVMIGRKTVGVCVFNFRVMVACDGSFRRRAVKIGMKKRY